MHNYTIVKDKQFGYLKYVPNEDINLKEFYTYNYFDYLYKKMNTNRSATHTTISTNLSDVNWLRDTYFNDINEFLNIHAKTLPKSILDIGCAHLYFLKYMHEYNWDCYGVDPLLGVADHDIEEHINVFNGTLEEFSKSNSRQFSCATLHNVLEHIPDPEKVIQQVYNLLLDDGILILKVPNDFNQLQLITNDYIENKNYWISIPDHINYFSYASLEKLLTSNHFKILHKTSDFPMEFFLLMGDNYIDNTSLGSICHTKRKCFEAFIPTQLRQDLYKSFADLNLGRNIILFAQKQV